MLQILATAAVLISRIKVFRRREDILVLPFYSLEQLLQISKDRIYENMHEKCLQES